MNGSLSMQFLLATRLALVLLLLTVLAHGGGPLVMGGPHLGTPGQPITWNTSHAIEYRVDGGPLAKNSSGAIVVGNAAGVTRVQQMFANWQAVPTATISYQNIGGILATGSFVGGDAQTAEDFNAVHGSCVAGAQNPIIFDADGTLFSQLIGDPNVIGFASICNVDPSTGKIVAAEGVLNGKFQDGTDVGSNYELTAAEFDQAFTHEFGHFSGLDHSQINVSVLSGKPLQCDLNSLAGLPLMFPILQCQARVSVGLPALAPDDIAWISYLYPVQAPAPAGKQAFGSVYGVIRGNVYFSDGITQAQGVNVIARQVDDPGTSQNESLRVAFSAVSGFQFTGNFGQSVTCTDPANPTTATCRNLGGDATGSRDPRVIGWYEIPVLAGTYTISVESVDPGFTGGSSLNPLYFPIPAPGTAAPVLNIQVPAGGVVNVPITLDGTDLRFDSFETSSLIRHPEFGEVAASTRPTGVAS